VLSFLGDKSIIHAETGFERCFIPEKRFVSPYLQKRYRQFILQFNRQFFPHGEAGGFFYGFGGNCERRDRNGKR
jgi:hypothetical protein